MPQSKRTRAPYLLCSQILEDRLPPGDILLGVGMTLTSFASDRVGGTEALVTTRRLGGLSGDDEDDAANVSIIAGGAAIAGRRRGGTGRSASPAPSTPATALSAATSVSE